MHPIAFAELLMPAEPATVRPDQLLRGQPDPQVSNRYTAPTGQFFCGEWCAGSGDWRVAYDPHEEEFCPLLEGEVRLTPDSDTPRLPRTGDAFVVPGGFAGTWENLTPVRKLYAIMTLKDFPR
jgi:uncharacterized cupin superfamily protein